jgi:predicted GNAT family N-acyltransferase
MPRNAQEYYNLATKNGKQITLKEAQDTVEAINDWTGGGYEEIRKDQKEGRVNERATLIDNYIKNLTPYKGEVYRGITFDNKKEMEDWLKGDKDGVLDNQNAHASWSSELEVAKGFATDIEEDDLDRVPVVIKSVNNKSGVSIFNLSWLGKIESEVIVPKNAKHKVKSVREEGGVMYVDVEEVDPLQEKVSINQKKVSKSSKTTTAKPGIEAEEPEKNTNPAKTKLQPSVMSKADQAKIGGEWAKTAIDFVNLVKKAEQLPPGSFPKQEYVLGKKDIVTESFIVTTALKNYGEGEDIDKSEEVDVVSLNDKSGKPQGFFCIGKEASKKDSMYIEFLGSNPSNVINEKKGVGKEIMYHAIQESRKRGLKGKIKLQALEGAVPFYKTIGFKETIDKEGDSYFDLSEESANAFIKEYEKKLK